jgi:hypothetical protein
MSVCLNIIVAVSFQSLSEKPVRWMRELARPLQSTPFQPDSTAFLRGLR